MTLIFIFIITFAVVIGLVIPIVALVKCATSNLSKRAKTLWIVPMALTLPVTGYLYLTFNAKTATRRVFSALALAFVVWGMYINYGLLFNPDPPPPHESLGSSLIHDAETRSQATTVSLIDTTVDSLSRYPQTPPNNIQPIVDDLQTYSQEIQVSSPLEASKQGLTARELSALARQIANEGATPENLQKWNTAFSARHDPKP